MNNNDIFLNFLSKNIIGNKIIICFQCNLITHIDLYNDQPNCINSYYSSFHIFLQLYKDDIKNIRNIIKESLIDTKITNICFLYNKKENTIIRSKSKIKYFNFKK